MSLNCCQGIETPATRWKRAESKIWPRDMRLRHGIRCEAHSGDQAKNPGSFPATPTADVLVDLNTERLANWTIFHNFLDRSILIHPLMPLILDWTPLVTRLLCFLRGNWSWYIVYRGVVSGPFGRLPRPEFEPCPLLKVFFSLGTNYFPPAIS